MQVKLMLRQPYRRKSQLAPHKAEPAKEEVKHRKAALAAWRSKAAPAREPKPLSKT